MALTDTAARNAKPKAKPYRLYDSGGLYLEIAPSGGKWWRLKYRIDGKEKRLSIGVYSSAGSSKVVTGLKEAREKATDAKRLLADGIDPSHHRRMAKAARIERGTNSFEAVAREWFDKNRANWVDSHSKKVISRLERDIFPYLGKRPIAEITAPELLAVIRKIENRAVESAHRTLGHCSQIFRYGVATARVPHNVAADLKGALAPTQKQHFAAVTDPDQVGGLLRAIDAYKGTLIVQSALKLAPLVFVRPGELRKARWADIDLEAQEWRYKATKTGIDHVVPLSEQAVDILKQLQPVTDRSEYVFPSARSAKRPMSDNAVLAALRRAGIEKDEMTGHGFRAMARTILDEVLGFRPDMIEQQLAHTVRDPLGRAYNRTSHLPERHKMMQAWADYLDQLKNKGTLIPLKAMRRKTTRA